jgi:KDO2-lipid IV(A) lauroyltransferase
VNSSAPTKIAPRSGARADPSNGIGAASRVWLRALFWLARHAPWLLRAVKPLAVMLAVQCSAKVRRATAANGRRIIGRNLSNPECRRFGRRVIGHFYEFVLDVGRSGSMSADALRGQIESIAGRDAYKSHRAAGKGAIIVTAHVGPFEVGFAALTEVERNIHVVFKRDAMDGFELRRQVLREKLGILEAPIDDGWSTWMRLRDALARDHVVVMQGDRAMPGQKAAAVPFLGGHVMLPLGPIKLAEISGSPIVPVFTVRGPSGRCRVFAEPPIQVDRNARMVDGVHPALLELARAIEKIVSAFPDQWLVLDEAFVEDIVDLRESAHDYRPV